MEVGVDGDMPLDYASIHIFPAENRYETIICSNGKEENLVAGLLEMLLPHLPKLNELYLKGSNATFMLVLSENLSAAAWFTKSNLKRFLHIVGLPDLIHSINAIGDEMSQLEEAKSFHLSLYGKSEDEITSSDASKNELLQAIDSRLMALREELTAAFDEAACATCSYQEIVDLAKFSEHFGALNLRNSLVKILEPNQKSPIGGPQSDDKFQISGNLRDDKINKIDNEAQISKPMYSTTPVKYSVSPAKVAQVERQNSTESEDSFDSSDGEKMSAERSRTLTRSAMPRRSASPMRRIQIGRAGPHRAPALTIKTLNYFPAREKNWPQEDVTVNSSDDGPEQSNKKPMNDVRRMSVQDAISLFESKQRDKTADTQKRKSLTNISISANKSVLRRWSSDLGEASVECQPESEDAYKTPIQMVKDEVSKCSAEAKLGPDSVIVANTVETPKVDENLERLEKNSSELIDGQAYINVTQEQEIITKSNTATDWNRLKEAELNEMLIKMREPKPARYAKPQPSRNKNVPAEKRGGFYDHYKEKRDEKLRGENFKKRAEKETQVKATQQIPDARKGEMTSKNANDVDKKRALPKTQKLLINSPQPTNLKKEASKAIATKKISPRPSPLLPTRKSWPSTPLASNTGTSPAKPPVGISSIGTTPPRQRGQQIPSLSQSKPKIEKSQQQQKNVRDSWADGSKDPKSLNDKKQLVPKKNSKSTKTKVVTAPEGSGMTSAKPALYNRGTKKSSVVPLESKPFLRKGSRTSPGAGPVVNKKKNSHSEKSLKSLKNPVDTQETAEAASFFNLEGQHQEGNVTSVGSSDGLMELEAPVNSQQPCSETENFDSIAADRDNDLNNIGDSSLEIQAEEEPSISPSAWVEAEEQQAVLSSNENTCQLTSSDNTVLVGLSSSRVRHSLSQMLQEESNEPDTVEWGNADNLSSIIYQKDAPKGLKRLLKFARKSKGDANSSGWSSPSVFSEGEDDTDNQLRKAALSAKIYGHQKTLFSEGYEKKLDAGELYSSQANVTRFNVQSSLPKLNDDGGSAAVPSTKATRSFFSLSAFRGSTK